MVTGSPSIVFVTGSHRTVMPRGRRRFEAASSSDATWGATIVGWAGMACENSADPTRFSPW